MNKEQLKKLAWHQIRVRPVARRIDSLTQNELPPVDDRWLVSDVDGQGMFINNTRTGHGMRVPYDHILEYMTDAERESSGLVMLKSQVFLSGNRMWLDPIHSLTGAWKKGRGRTPALLR